MALEKTKSIQHDGCQSGNTKMVTNYKVAAILVFQKIAVYFKLNYFKLIHLQANMLSSFFFYLFCSEPY